MLRSSGSGNTIVFNPNLTRSSGTGISFSNLTNSQVTVNGTVHATVDTPSNSGISHASPGTQITFNNTLSGNGRFYMSNAVGDAGGATFTAANTYQGATSVTSGVLTVTGDGTFGDGTGFIGIFGPSTATTTDAVLVLHNLNTSTISNDYIFGGDGQSGAGVLRITGGNATFTGEGRATGNGGSTTVLNTASGSTLTFANTFRVMSFSGGVLQFDGDGDIQTTGSGAIIENVGSGSSTITKNGSGTLTFGGAANTYEGPTIINGGALVLNAAGNSINGGGLTLNSGTSASLSKSDQIGNSILTLNSATFSTNGFDEALGALVLQGTSNFDLGSGDSVIAFADSSAQSWTAGQTFLLLNWTGSLSGGGTDQVIFGSDASGLTSGQLSQITFRDPDGFGAGDFAAQILGTGEVVPVPEASTYALVLGLVAGVYLIYRRRKQAK